MDNCLKKKRLRMTKSGFIYLISYKFVLKLLLNGPCLVVLSVSVINIKKYYLIYEIF